MGSVYTKEKLERVRQEILATNLPLQEQAKNLVFGKGSPNAPIIFIGEAPGAKEDELGIPFVGAAGKELDKLLGKIGLSLDEVYIANILKYRPPQNRDPTLDEIKTHTPFLIKQILAIEPKIICTLGNFATKFVLAGFSVEDMNNIGGVSGLHGKVHKVKLNNHDFVVIPLYHPAAMLYNPRLRGVLADDFLLMGKLLEEMGLSLRGKEAQKGLGDFI